MFVSNSATLSTFSDASTSLDTKSASSPIAVFKKIASLITTHAKLLYIVYVMSSKRFSTLIELMGRKIVNYQLNDA